MSLSSKFGLVVFLGSLIVSPAFAQIPNPYGAAIDNESARKVAAAAIAEARKNSWNMAVAIVDPAGELVYFEKLDGISGGKREYRDRQGAVERAVQTANESAAGRPCHRWSGPTHARAG